MSCHAQSGATQAPPIAPVRAKKSGVKQDDSEISPLAGPSASRQKLGSLSSGTTQSPSNNSHMIEKPADLGTTLANHQITEPTFNLFECPLNDELDVQSDLPGEEDLAVHIGSQQF